MELESIIELLKAVDDSKLTKFELRDGDLSIKMERGTCDSKAVYVSASPQIPAAVIEPGFSGSAGESVNAPSGASQDKEITSPLVGIYHGAAGDKAVRAGDSVKKGDIVCMIEAMKLMNEVTMPEDGTITWVACEENDSVEYGQLLFKYQ